jgi:hypothetical protein
MSPIMPTWRSCGGRIESVAQLQLPRLVVDREFCIQCMEAELHRRQQRLF